MEAKDTVMDEKQLEDIIWRTATEGIPTQRGYGGALIEAQAEISFKAGYDEGLKVGILDSKELDAGIMRAEHKAGIQEAVEWVRNEAYEDLMDTDDFARWQAQLEKWGIE